MSDTSKKLKVWLEKLHENPMNALEECKASYNRTNETYTDKLYESIGFMAAFNIRLKRDDLALAEFRNHRFWEGNARASSSGQMSILVARFLLGAAEARGALYEQARTYAKVVEFFLSEKTEPSLIPGVLKHKTIYGLLDQLAKGGIKKVAVAPARNNSDESDSSVASDESDADDIENSDESDGESEGDGDEGSSAAAARSMGSSPSTTRKSGVSFWADFTKRAKEIAAQGKMPVLAAFKQDDWAKLERYLKDRRVMVVCSGSIGDDGWVEVNCETVVRSKA